MDDAHDEQEQQRNVEESEESSSHVLVMEHGLAIIQDLAYLRRTHLREIQFPLKCILIRIGMSAFRGCENINSLYRLPSGLQTIDAFAFHGCCNGLRHVHLPENLRVIETGAFAQCRSLYNIRIPPRITRIRHGTFKECSSLRSVEMPLTVKQIEEEAFMGCVELINICLPKTITKFDPSAFTNCPKLLLQLLPARSGGISSRGHRNASDSSSPPILAALQDRFDRLPLHELCYYQSYIDAATLLEDAITEQLYYFDECFDGMGLNPLHILAMSAKPNLNLSKRLMERVEEETEALHQLEQDCLRFLFCFRRVVVSSPTEKVDFFVQDNFDQYPLSYATLNAAPGSTRLMEVLLQPRLAREIRGLGLDYYKVDLQNKVHKIIDVLDDGGTTESRVDTLSQLSSLLHLYTTKEMLSLLELAVWKSKMDEQRQQCDRNACRTICGADIIIFNVVPFLMEAPLSNHFS